MTTLEPNRPINSNYDFIPTSVIPYGSNLYIGMGLSALSAIFIGASFIIKKKSLIALGMSGSTRAGAGGYGYLCSCMWWTGLLSMAVGEVLNFIAYAFAPATLVTPLGALSVIVTALLSATFLGEALNILGKIGCGLCVIGSTMIVIHAPKDAEVTSMEELEEKLLQPGFLIYVLIITTIALILIFHFSPRYGSRNVVVYIAICSLIGGFSVLGCKAIGLAIKQTINGKSELGNWLTWFALASLIVCVCTQMNYLNKALDVFNTSVVTPIYYVFFTTFVILASAMLFREWEGMAATDVLGLLSGFFTVVLAIFQLNAFRDSDIRWAGISGIFASSSSLPEGRRTSLSSESRQSLLRVNIDEEDGLSSQTLPYGSAKRNGT